MINIEQAVCEKFPALRQQPQIIQKPTFSFLRKLIHEREINCFLEEHRGLDPVAFIDSVFDYFNFSYIVSKRDKENIPSQGRVVIIANHPIGSLDGLAILRMVYEVRRDVKIVANDMLMNFSELRPLFVAADNMGQSGSVRTFRNALDDLEQERALIIFPAGEVSRARPSGVKDTRWRPGFLKLARRAGAPTLPVFIRAKNSLWFYSASMLYKPLGTALLAKEMFNKRSATIRFHVGAPIPVSSLVTPSLTDRALIKRIRKHLYKLAGKQARPFFETEKTIAHPEDRRDLLQELPKMHSLGETRDGKRILLTDYHQSPSTLREIGRLREVTFRKVGEGTGARRDLDRFDQHYQHLLLWDQSALSLAGAYRLGDIAALQKSGYVGPAEIYTRTLFHFESAMTPLLSQCLELGRSFVAAEYMGRNSLDYLWQGIGSLLRQQSHIRYLLGPVTISARLDRSLTEHLVYFYKQYYGAKERLATARNAYLIPQDRLEYLEAIYQGLSSDEAFNQLQQVFNGADERVPVLFRQYAALFKPGGFQLLAFSVDPDFSDCLDGLFLADLTLMKDNKRQRYIGVSS